MGSSVDRILNTTKLVPDKTKERIFFGEYSGFQRYDNPQYKFAVSLEEKQRNAFWNPKEIKMDSDAIGFFELPEFIQEVMIRVWLFQTLMDSAQNSGLEEVLASLCTNPEFEAMFKTQGYFELIHSLSYSHILRGIFSDARKVFDRIDDYPEIKNRINKEIEIYHKVKTIDDITDETEKKKLVLELLVSILALEGIKFKVSFLVTYVINNAYNNKIQKSARMIKLINFDEDLHTSMISGTIQILKRTPIEGFTDLIKSQWFDDMVDRVFTEAYDGEISWAEYLLTLGDIPTLTIPVIEQFMKYYIDELRTSIGLSKKYNQEKTDVAQWYESYKDINKDNTAQQEAEGTAYSIGILEDDLPEGKLDFIPADRKEIIKLKPTIFEIRAEMAGLIEEDVKENGGE